MSAMSVTEAIKARRAVRVFTDQPVGETLVREIISLASHAPSNSNIQPWNVYVVSGEALKNALQSINDGMYGGGQMETPEFPTYPEKMREPYRTRRYECGERMYDALGIERQDKAGRIGQVMKNFQFFGAPVGIILTMDKSMDMGQALDIGAFMQNILLLAKERGLDTCPQVSWTLWPIRVRTALNIPENEKVMVGISIGYADEENAVNHLDQPRVPLDDYVSMEGF